MGRGTHTGAQTYGYTHMDWCAHTRAYKRSFMLRCQSQSGLPLHQHQGGSTTFWAQCLIKKKEPRSSHGYLDHQVALGKNQGTFINHHEEVHAIHQPKA